MKTIGKVSIIVGDFEWTKLCQNTEQEEFIVIVLERQGDRAHICINMLESRNKWRESTVDHNYCRGTIAEVDKCVKPWLHWAWTCCKHFLDPNLLNHRWFSGLVLVGVNTHWWSKICKFNEIVPKKESLATPNNYLRQSNGWQIAVSSANF